MIDFRYHLVSIIAVFIALAVGIVLGSGPLKPTIDQALTSRYEQLQQDKEKLRGEIEVLENENEYYEQSSQATAPMVIASRLTGRTAVVVVLPGADAKLADSVTKTMTAASATISGRVAITDAYLDPERSTELNTLVTSLTPPGVSFPDGANAATQAATVLASALVTRDGTKAGQPDEPSAALLSGLSELGFIQVTGEPSKRATLAVVIAPPAPKTVDDITRADNAGLLEVVSALDAQDNGSVAGGPVGSAGDGAFLRALRDEDTVSSNVSSVDSADTSPGQQAMVFSLLNEIQGESGQYGLGPGASAPMPKLAAADR